MQASGDIHDFLRYLMGAKLRFLQEREVGLDLYHSGYLGLAVFCLAVASATVFLLSVFLVIPKRRHVVGILLGLGIAAVAAGSLSSFLNYRSLPESAPAIIRDTAGSAPIPGTGQDAAVIALPFLLGAGTLFADAAGCLYLAVFWSFSRERRGGK